MILAVKTCGLAVTNILEDHTVYIFRAEIEVGTNVSDCPVWKAENAAVGFDVLTTCQPSTVWCSRERLPAVAAQPAKVRQSL
jgi:hypothetical protein